MTEKCFSRWNYVHYYSFEVAANSGHTAAMLHSMRQFICLADSLITITLNLARSRFCSHCCGCWWSCSGCQDICRHSLGQIQVLYSQLNYPTEAGRWRVSDLCYHWFMVNDNSHDFSIWWIFQILWHTRAHTCVCVSVCVYVCHRRVSTIA